MLLTVEGIAESLCSSLLRRIVHSARQDSKNFGFDTARLGPNGGMPILLLILCAGRTSALSSRQVVTTLLYRLLLPQTLQRRPLQLERERRERAPPVPLREFPTILTSIEDTTR